ncbi:hypothetical protein TNCV_3466981 [Trichonephila clavipes]|nr:hypothetical protein TNCV_3466981 [Trichonephila clavipes]
MVTRKLNLTSTYTSQTWSRGRLKFNVCALHGGNWGTCDKEPQSLLESGEISILETLEKRRSDLPPPPE